MPSMVYENYQTLVLLMGVNGKTSNAYPNFWLICWKNVTMLLSSRISGGAEVELPSPERAGADRSSSRKLWKPPKYGKSCGPLNGV